MSEVRQIEIKRFRAIRKLVWNPNPGINCLIGPGDSGKTTLLDAIDYALAARRSIAFSDADFYKQDSTKPIEILVTIGNLDSKLINLETYGIFLRSFDGSTGLISDEPQVNQEIVITIKLTVEDDLEPYWKLFSERANEQGDERNLQWKHRVLNTPGRLGAAAKYHLSWSKKSILNKLSDEEINVASALSQLVRSARSSFAGQEIEGVEEVLSTVKKTANKLGVPVGNLKAQLDASSVNFSKGGISLHDDENIPLTNLGTGSSRLLMSGLQKTTTISNIILVDEAEYGLEPYRITRLLNELGSKDKSSEQQVFLTTHSPYVIRELEAKQLHVLRKLEYKQHSHRVYSIDGGNAEQKTVRVCAESFFNQSVIVCEGKTEIGLIKGIDLFNHTQGENSIQAYGAYWADGAGSSMFERAKVFNAMGYRTAIFKDSDNNDDESTHKSECSKLGIDIFEWGNGYATEDVLFHSCPIKEIPKLIQTAVDRKGTDAIDQNLKNYSNDVLNLDSCMNDFKDEMRTILSAVAKSKSWFKDIEPAEIIAHDIISPKYSEFKKELTEPIDLLFQWAKKSVEN